MDYLEQVVDTFVRLSYLRSSSSSSSTSSSSSFPRCSSPLLVAWHNPNRSYCETNTDLAERGFKRRIFLRISIQFSSSPPSLKSRILSLLISDSSNISSTKDLLSFFQLNIILLKLFVLTFSNPHLTSFSLFMHWILFFGHIFLLFSSAI